METTEKIVEAYYRYVKNLFTISNLKIKNDEIDILAIGYEKNEIVKFHIEVSVSISSSFSKLNSKDFEKEKLKDRNNTAAQRRTIGYFIEKKFNKKEHLEKLKQLGFEDGSYRKVIVSWGWTDKAKVIADDNNIELKDFREIICEIGDTFKKDKTYFKDDTLRTIQLFGKAIQELNKLKM